MTRQRELDAPLHAVERGDEKEEDHQERDVGHRRGRDLGGQRTAHQFHSVRSPRDSSVTFSAPAARSCSSTASITRYGTARSAFTVNGCSRFEAVTVRIAVVRSSRLPSGSVSCSPAENRKRSSDRKSTRL